jgi:hypothetical protein
MRIFLGLIILLSLNVSLTLAQPPGDPLAASEGELITGIVAVDGATIYVGPDFAYRIIGQLPINGSVTIIGRRGDFRTSWNGDQWLEIPYGGDSAWVYARLVRTSVPFNSIPPTGRKLPRNGNGRVPEEFDLSDNICDRWNGSFTQDGSLLTADININVTYPPLTGANVYSVIVIAPSGIRTAFDSETDSATIIGRKLRSRFEYGTYTWRVAPYWTTGTSRYSWQQVCLLETGGKFEYPDPRATGG